MSDMDEPWWQDPRGSVFSVAQGPNIQSAMWHSWSPFESVTRMMSSTAVHLRDGLVHCASSGWFEKYIRMDCRVPIQSVEYYDAKKGAYVPYQRQSDNTWGYYQGAGDFPVKLRITSVLGDVVEGCSFLEINCTCCAYCDECQKSKKLTIMPVQEPHTLCNRPLKEC